MLRHAELHRCTISTPSTLQIITLLSAPPRQPIPLPLFACRGSGPPSSSRRNHGCRHRMRLHLPGRAVPAQARERARPQGGHQRGPRHHAQVLLQHQLLVCCYSPLNPMLALCVRSRALSVAMAVRLVLLSVAPSFFRVLSVLRQCEG
jgi:hypothetical protein